MNLFLIRHGETYENHDGIIQGWLDTELNETGVAQAVEAANNFTKKIDAIYSSDLKRAIRTADEFRRHNESVPYYVDARIRERNFGDAAGKHGGDYNWEEFWSLEDTVTIPNAELLTDFTQRVKEFLDELRNQPYESALIVAHSGVLNRVRAITEPNFTHHHYNNGTMLEISI